MKKIKIIVIALSVMITPSILYHPIKAKAATTNLTEDNVIIDCYNAQGNLIVTDSTEEKFLKSFAQRKGISYDEAKKINDNSINRVQLRRPTEQTKYKTVKQYFRVNSDINLVMATEVAYLYSNVDDEVLSIVNIGNPYMGVKGASLNKWSGGEFNIEQTSKSARISQTGQAHLEVSRSVSGGLYKNGITFAYDVGNTKVYYTDVETYVMKISLSDLR